MKYDLNKINKLNVINSYYFFQMYEIGSFKK